MNELRIRKDVGTDTATLVVFDPGNLTARWDDDPDWWTGDGDLDVEEDSHRLVYVDTKSDGRYQVEVTTHPAVVRDAVSLLKRPSLLVPTGEILFGAGECLPGGGGDAIREYLGSTRVEPGTYEVTVLAAPVPDGYSGAYSFCLVRLDVATASTQP